MPDTELQHLSSRLGYHFKDAELLKKALTHRSVGANHNERLEFLGDAVLDLLIADELFQRFPHATEGELTRLRASLVKGRTLSQLASELDVGCCLTLGTGEIKSGGQHRESILGDALEAILGAIYLESGIDVCRERVRDWFQERLISITLDVDEKDAKTRLQEHLQGLGKPLPVYEVIGTEGAHHNQTLTVSCTVAGLDEPIVAQASNRKKAEKKAAQLALSILLGEPYV